MGTDVIVDRLPMFGGLHLLAKNVQASVINAGDGMNEHPTQALLDMFTMREHRGGIRGLTVAIIGDAAHSRVARSNIWGLTAMGASVRICAPATLLPDEMEKMGAHVTTDIREAAEGADVLMGLRLQLERQKAGLLPSMNEYAARFGISREVAASPERTAFLCTADDRGIRSPPTWPGRPLGHREQVTSGWRADGASVSLLEEK